MKIAQKIRISILISIVILLGFTTIAMFNYNTYGKIIKDDIKNISKLTSTNIYSDINNELTKPIFVALTMANDSFLKSWLLEEDKRHDNPDHIASLQQYLLGIKAKYDYNSVFLVSEHSKNYYHYQGLHKTISPEDDHDKWYYDYIDGNQDYELDVDTDEANKDTLSIFINCRIVDNNNRLLGVTGVGLEMNDVQKLLDSFENSFSLEATLVDSNGHIMVHTDQNKIESANIYDEPFISDLKDQITSNKISLETFPYVDHQTKGYLITRYIEELDWYLIIKKDTSILKKSFQEQVLRDFFVLIIAIILVLLIVNRIIHNYQKKMNKVAKTDHLTNLVNRRGFYENLEENLESSLSHHEPLYVFVFDIDNFKSINDNYGHQFGDRIIALLASIASDTIGDKGMVSRWGGDEFAGYIIGHQGGAIIESLYSKIHKETDLSNYKVTISLGMTIAGKVDTTETLIYRADKSLYQAKSEGKDKYIIN